MNTPYEHALEFAKTAHGEQKRKYTNEPYWYHLVSVANIVSSVTHNTPEMVQAALLHDVLEDTPTPRGELEREFGPTVTGYVLALTDPPAVAGNRAARKAIVCGVMLKACWEVKTIKLADLIDNTGSIVAHDPNFARVYLHEKDVLLNCLVGGDQTLWNLARTLCDRGLAATRIGKEPT